MTVSDGKGGTGQATISVVVAGANLSPTVTAARTPTGNTRVGVPLAFTATGTDPDGDPLTYAWDFGDSTTSTQQNPTKSFLTAATFNVTVTVSDGKGGTGTATLSVVVQANRSPTISTATATPSDGVAPLTTTFAATATDPDGHTVEMWNAQYCHGPGFPRLSAGGGEDDRRQAGRDPGETMLATGQLTDQLV